MLTSSPEGLELYRRLLEELASKWTLSVLDCLCAGPQRFNAIRKATGGVTQKALTQCLRRLEAAGLVTRTVIDAAPLGVVYAISPLGRSLEPHLRGLIGWAEEHWKEVLACEEAFKNS